MITNLEKYKKDLDKLIFDGEVLLLVMFRERFPQKFNELNENQMGSNLKTTAINAPSFSDSYQQWYTEALVLIKQLLPDRVENFKKLYEKSKTRRKDMTSDDYTIEDYLNGLKVTRSVDYDEIVIADPSAAITRYQQQLNILKSVEKRFTSTLFDIKQLVQADLFDSELEAAKELNKKGFVRGAGAVAGVVLEKHLSQVCENHCIKITRVNPTISIFNDKLKDAGIYETPIWRKLQHLGDIRNQCDHNKEKEPTQADIDELIIGVENIIKSLF